VETAGLIKRADHLEGAGQGLIFITRIAPFQHYGILRIIQEKITTLEA
jgi:hypothetical protein